MRTAVQYIMYYLGCWKMELAHAYSLYSIQIHQRETPFPKESITKRVEKESNIY